MKGLAKVDLERVALALANHQLMKDQLNEFLASKEGRKAAQFNLYFYTNSFFDKLFKRSHKDRWERKRKEYKEEYGKEFNDLKMAQLWIGRSNIPQKFRPYVYYSAPEWFGRGLEFVWNDTAKELTTLYESANNGSDLLLGEEFTTFVNKLIDYPN
jgi:hypothetical protein